MSNVCEFCENSFSTKTSLLYHQKKAKYCLEKQGKTPTFIKCKNCEKKFQRKQRLAEHEEKCNVQGQLEEMKRKIRDQKEIITKLSTILREREDHLREQIRNLTKNYEAQIRDLTSKLENVAIKGVTKSTNTNILKLECLTDEHLKESARLLTAKDVIDATALAKFAAETSFKNRVLPTDIARKTLTWRKANGKMSKDPKGKKLAVKFFSSIKDCDEIINSVRDQILSELNTEVSDIERQDIFDRMNEIIKVEKGVKKISEGEEHELKEEFVAKLCQVLPNPE
jgi:hypothetical protein